MTTEGDTVGNCLKNRRKLKGDARSKLELPWIIGCRWRAGLGVEKIYIQCVVFVDQIEDIGGELKPKLVRKCKGTGDTQVGEDRIGFYANVAGQITRVEAACRACGCRGVDIAGKIEGPGRRILREHRSSAATCGSAVRCYRVGSIGQWIEVEVCIAAGEDMEWTARRELKDRRDREAGQNGRNETRTSDMPSVIHAGEYEAMALIEGRDAAFGVWREVALRRVRGGDDVSGVVDCMGPGVAQQKLIVIREALFQVHAQPVVVGGACRKIRRHIAEGYGNAFAEPIGKGDLARQCDTWPGSDRRVGKKGCQRGVEPGGAEEIQQGGSNKRSSRPHAAWIHAGGGCDGQWIRCWTRRCWSRGPGFHSVHRIPPVGDQKLWIDWVHIDGAVQMAAACGVVGNVQREVMAEVLFDPERDLLHVGSYKVQIGRKARWKNREREAGGKEVLIDKDRVRIVRIEALLVGEISHAGRTGTTTVGISKRTLKRVGRIKI